MAQKKPKKYPSVWTHKDIKDGWYTDAHGKPRPIGWFQRNIKKTVQGLLKTAEWAGSTVDVHKHHVPERRNSWSGELYEAQTHEFCHVLKHPSGAELHVYEGGETD